MRKYLTILFLAPTIANTETISLYGQQVEVDMSNATPQDRVVLGVTQKTEQELKRYFGAITGNQNAYNDLMEAGRQSKQQRIKKIRQELNSAEFKHQLKDLRGYCDNLGNALLDMRKDFEEAKRKDEARGQTYDIQDGYAYYLSELSSNSDTKSKARYMFINEYMQSKKVLEAHLYHIDEAKKICHKDLTTISTKPEVWVEERAKVDRFIEKLGVYSQM